MSNKHKELLEQKQKAETEITVRVIHALCDFYQETGLPVSSVNINIIPIEADELGVGYGVESTSIGVSL